MKTSLHCRITEKRLDKLRLYAARRQKTMTQLISDFIDSLPTEAGDKRLEVDTRVEKLPASPQD
ncbi:MAG: hypothetical protein F6K01_09865 [Okeania sp. SIO1I7]|nr:hypothetical protein [Okeania sp. SIO1I7]